MIFTSCVKNGLPGESKHSERPGGKIVTKGLCHTKGLNKEITESLSQITTMVIFWFEFLEGKS
jgi:hypothetical protein